MINSPIFSQPAATASVSIQLSMGNHVLCVDSEALIPLSCFLFRLAFAQGALPTFSILVVMQHHMRLAYCGLVYCYRTQKSFKTL